MVSILSSSTSALTAYILFDRFQKEEESSQNLSLTVVNASLAGLVMVTGICDDVNVYSSLFIGFTAAIIYLVSIQVLEKYEIDDPVEAV
mmetsp:Transcript_2021/g.3012  ORF Transcript_2021/g.3012 Transcript_2021/m.3012 type:complete len:89 (+) Transcript_2021:1390-1656(+)